MSTETGQSQTDRQTALHIAEHVLPLNLDREALSERLDGLLKPVVERAALACKEHRKVAKAALVAHEAALTAKTTGGFWLAPLEDKADALTQETAIRFLEAYTRVLEMNGVDRAVGFARRGEVWTPYDVAQDQVAWVAQLDTFASRRPVAPSQI